MGCGRGEAELLLLLSGEYIGFRGDGTRLGEPRFGEGNPMEGRLLECPKCWGDCPVAINEGGENSPRSKPA